MTSATALSVNTLQDVHFLLPAIYSEASAGAYGRSFSRIEKLTGRRLRDIAANERAWTEIAAKIVWSTAFPAATPTASKRNFDGFVARIVSAIRAARNHVAAPVVTTDVAAAWARFMDYVKTVENMADGKGGKILPNMFTVSMSTLRSRCAHIHPAALDTAALSAALAACPRDKATTLRKAVAAFNNLILNRGGHIAIGDLLPQAPIRDLPRLRDSALDWTKFTPGFLASRDHAIRRAIEGARPVRDRFNGRLGADPLAETRGARKGRKRPVRNKGVAIKAHLNALSWLVRHAFADRGEAYSLASIKDLFSVEIIDRAVQVYVERATTSDVMLDPDKTASGSIILDRLATLSARNGFPVDVINALDDARYDEVDSFQAREMSAEREKFVKLLERDPALPRAIITGPRRLHEELIPKFDDWDNLADRHRSASCHLAIGAALLALQLARAIRSRNLNDLLIGGTMAELITPVREMKPWLDIARGRTKNRRPIEGEIPERQWKVIEFYLKVARPRWCGRHKVCPDKNDYLIPGPKGVAVSRQSFNRIWNRTLATLGIPGLEPHMMRHVAATLWLSVHPGDYATVAAFLCDSVRTVEKFYARGEGAAAAKLFAEVLEQMDPTLKSFLVWR